MLATWRRAELPPQWWSRSRHGASPSSGGGSTRWGAPLRAGRLPRSRLPGDRAAHPTDQVCPLVAGIAQSRRAESREEVGNDYRQ